MERPPEKTTEHRFTLKVYLEDTDAQGVVYHANYLRFIERARTEMLEQLGSRLADLQARGWTLVVHEMQLKFHRPAKIHDDLEVRSHIERASDYRVTFHQEVYRPGESNPLFCADVHVVAVDKDLTLRPLPPELLS